MKEYFNRDWKEWLQQHELNSFETLWSRDDDWFEAPNEGRGGWSGVCRLEIDGRALFLKKQENHLSRSLAHPIGIPTFQREYENIRRFDSFGIPCLTVVYFGCIGKRSILITEALDDYQPLDKITAHFHEYGFPPLAKRRQLLESMALLLRRTHDAGLMHNCCYSKHIFIKGHIEGDKFISEDYHSRFIDLEKVKRATQAKRQRDLETLNRRTPHWSRSDRLRFLLSYLGKKRCSPAVRRYINTLKQNSK